jgi:thiol-disulfide isomerase/thioredoxin
MARRAGDPIGNAAAYVATAVALEDPSVDRPSSQKAINAFAARSRGKSPLIADLLGKLAEEKTESAQDQQAIYLSIVQGFPGTPAAHVAAARLAKLDMEKFESAVDPAEAANDPRIGRPFEFAFQDAVSGEPVTSAGLRGRVLVIDFWATWCPPCVAAMPKMKELYEKYAPQGVVFIGVSHDDAGPAGLQKLLSFVAANEIPWAQYHQANRELSRAWNVSGIPSVFVVDQEGRVVTTEGDLDKVIPRLFGDQKAKTSKKKAAKKGK